MRRAISVTQLINKKFELLPFTGLWKASFGQPIIGGSWLIWGQSGSGKTRFVLQLCKYLAQFTRVAFNSLEEGDSPTMQQAFIDESMFEVKRRVILLNEPINELRERLEKHKSPHVAVVDSVQFAAINYREYIDFKKSFPNKMLVFISHAEGREPKGNTARSIRYDADVKVRIEGYKALPASRYGGGKPYIIWKEGAENYWNKDIN